MHLHSRNWWVAKLLENGLELTSVPQVTMPSTPPTANRKRTRLCSTDTSPVVNHNSTGATPLTPRRRAHDRSGESSRTDGGAAEACLH